VEQVESNIARHNPGATVIRADSQIVCDKPELVRGKRIVVIEDGPTLTHGEMEYGAGVVAAKRLEAAEVIDPRPWAVGSITNVFDTYPTVGKVLPAMGYGKAQLSDLEETVNRIPCDSVVIATPVDLQRVVSIKHPVSAVSYELSVRGKPGLPEVIGGFAEGLQPLRTRRAGS
jgi:predicted GTPase